MDRITALLVHPDPAVRTALRAELCRADFIRVPAPAARTMAATGRGATGGSTVTAFTLGLCSLVGSPQ